ncbi:NAD-dependent epimerase/dehydratase family protein [Paraburkholderia sp. J12]|uniref:NAD-dependent epimerase/dehydratase family protein n=1 Tax=Paraburkholderia sp. J12 TaxID=2805432 RepID=UPI002ABD6405|nr:NAD-dependent epimerase/dehydratase family protein [Paraburkholderia sp. J12]
MKRIYLIGGRGRLGQALAREYANDEVVALDRTVYEVWSREGAAGQVARYFDRLPSDTLIFVTSGLLDPRLPEEALLGVNYFLPKHVIDAVSPLGMRVITFGTAMEALSRANNPYIESKRRLSRYINDSVSAGGAGLHLQIHTLYGEGEPTPFMFLGQILAAIRQREVFRMTSGRQLREYHHLADDARAIRSLVESGLRGTVALSHGKPVTLREIAEIIFRAVGKSELLEVGALPDSEEENYERIFEPAVLPWAIEFRDSLPAIAEYLKTCLLKDPGLGEERVQ